VPSEYTDNTSNKNGVIIATGSLGDFSALSAAMESNAITIVISFLGAYVSLAKFITRDTSTPIADCFPTIIAAMKANHIKRLFALSTPSYWVVGQDVQTWKIRLYSQLPKLMAPQGHAEMAKIAENVVAGALAGRGEEDMEWTVFRVPHLTNNAPDRPVWAGFVGPDHKGSLELSRKSQARWLLREIGERQWVNKAPFLGNY
jgi:hypothetical protein